MICHLIAFLFVSDLFVSVTAQSVGDSCSSHFECNRDAGIYCSGFDNGVCTDQICGAGLSFCEARGASGCCYDPHTQYCAGIFPGTATCFDIVPEGQTCAESATYRAIGMLRCAEGTSCVIQNGCDIESLTEDCRGICEKPAVDPSTTDKPQDTPTHTPESTHEDDPDDTGSLESGDPVAEVLMGDSTDYELSDQRHSSSSDLSSGVIAGITVAAIALLGLAIGAVIIIYRRRQLRHQQQRDLDSLHNGVPGLDMGSQKEDSWPTHFT
eukprot:Clim_evm17s252 gene=Clim_evmTU17s252